MPMVPVLQYPDFNGIRYSRTSSSWYAENALRLEGLISAQVTRKLTGGKSYGHRANPQTRTRGKAEYDAKVKLYLEDYNLLTNLLQSKADAQGIGLHEVSWQLTGTLFERTLGTTRWDILGVRIQNEDIPVTEDGDDKQIEVSLDLDVMQILKDRRSIVNESSPFASFGG